MQVSFIREHLIKPHSGRKIFRLRFILPLFLFFGAINIFCLLPFIIHRQLPCNTMIDTNRCFVTVRHFGQHEISQGRFPQLLNIFSGHDVSSFGQGYCYPTTLLGIFINIPDVWYYLGDLWLHWTLAALTMTLYALRLRLSLLAAIIAGIVYAYTAPILWRFQGHWTFIHLLPYLPALLIITDEILSPSWCPKKERLMASGGVILGLMLLSQMIQILYYMALVLTPYILLRLILRGKKRGIMRVFIISVMIFILAILLSAPVFLPMLLNVKNSFRNVVAGADFASAHPLVYSHFYSLLFPDFFFSSKGYWGGGLPFESLFSAGAGVLFLSIVGLLVTGFAIGRARFRMIFPYLLFIVAFILGFGKAMPWFNLLVKYLPLYASFRAHGRVSFLIIMALAIFSAEGMQAIINLVITERKKNRIHLFILLAGVVAMITSLWLMCHFRTNEGTYKWMMSHNLTPGWTKTIRDKDIQNVRTSALSAIRPVLMIALGITLLTLASHLSRKHGLKLDVLVLLFIIFTFVRDVNIHQKIIMSKMSPPIQELIPRKVDDCLHRISALPPPHGKICNMSTHFANATLLYPNLEDVAGVDVNVSAKYGLFLNKVQKMHPDILQITSFFGFMQEPILKSLSIRWILIEKNDLWKILFPPVKIKTIAEENNLLLLEYLDWTPEVICENSQSNIEILTLRPGFLEARIKGAGEKGILFKSVASPYWKAQFNNIPVKWVEETPWMRVKVNGEGILKFRFINIWLRIGAWLCAFGIILTLALFIRSFMRQSNTGHETS